MLVVIAGIFGMAQTRQYFAIPHSDDGAESGPLFTSLNPLQTDAISLWVLPSTGGTSANTRCPGGASRYQRTEYLITAAEMAASGFPVGQQVNSIGFLIATAGVGTQTGTFSVYLKNTTDNTYTLGANWDVTGFTTAAVISNWTVPIAVGSYEVPFTGGSAFTYTGGAVYVAWEFSNPSGTVGTTNPTAYCEYLNTPNKLYGNRSNVAMPTALTSSNFRPATIFGNNFYTDIVQVTNIYTQERTPVPYGTPSPIDVRVVNVSGTSATFDVTVTVKDATNTITRYTSTKTVTALAANSATLVNFTGWNPNLQEDVKITATASTVAGENWLANNAMTITGNVNGNLYSYCYSNASPGGFGYTYPGTGTFLAKFKMNGQGKVTGSNLVIANSVGNTGNTTYAIVLNSAGTIVAQSANYVIQAADLGTNVNFTFPTPPVFTDEEFYVGIAQTAGTAQWYPMGTINETPQRANTYYESAITGGAIVALDNTWNFRFGIEAQVAPNFTLPTIITTAATSVTYNSATVNGTVNASGNNVAVSFEYGTTTAYGLTAPGTPASVTGSTVTGVLSNLSGLSATTTYHYRAVGSVGLFKFYGADMTFTTTASPTIVVTNFANNVTTNGATLRGTVNANNQTATATFEYGLTTSYGNTINGNPLTVTGNVTTPVTAIITGLTNNTLYHYRIVGTNSGGASYGNDITFTTGCSAPVAPGTITGLATVCQGATAVAFSVPAIANASTYFWTLPTGATIASGSGTNSITVNFGAAAVSGNVTVYGAGSCGDGPVATKAVTVNPSPVPSLVSGPLQSCIGSTGVIYSTQAGMTGYSWAISAGGTITAGAGTNTITVSWNTLGPQTIGLNYTNGSGCTAAAPVVFNISVVDRPVPTISGPSNACLGFTTNVYTTQAGNSAYTWTVSGGGTITAGAGTNAITVTWNTAGAQTVGVNYTIPAGCNAVTPASYTVTVNTTPTPTLSGPNSLCAGSTGVVYTTEAGFSNYVWTISYDGVITSGLNTNQVTVNWATAGARYIAVNYSNALGCSAVNPTYRNVTVLTVPVPVIFGEDTVCQGTTGVTYTTQAGNNNYVWTVSAGGTITAGAGTKTITVTWNTSGSQSVSVNYSNSLGCSGVQPTSFAVVVAPKPAAAGTITGAASVCSGATGIVYSVPAITNATTYNWTVPAGVTITAGANTRIITVAFGTTAASGVFSVNGVNNCGNGASSPNFSVTVNPIPAAAVITKVGDTLYSSAPTGNQWYRNGVAIAGATGKKFRPVYLGTYTAVVTLSGCSSPVSNAIIVTAIVATPDLEVSHSFDVYPNPTGGQFNIKVVSGKPVVLNIEIYNNLGALQWKQQNVSVDGTFIKAVDLGSVPAGVYMVALRNKDINLVHKIVIIK